MAAADARPIDVDISVVLTNGSFAHCLQHSGCVLHSNDKDAMGLKRVFNIYHRRMAIVPGQQYKFKVFKEFNRSLSRSGTGNNANAHTLIAPNADLEVTGSEATDHQRLALLIKTPKYVHGTDKSFLNVVGTTKWCYYEQ